MRRKSTPSRQACSEHICHAHSNTQHTICRGVSPTTTEPLSQYSMISQHCCSPDKPPLSVATHQACDSVLMMLWCFKFLVRTASSGWPHGSNFSFCTSRTTCNRASGSGTGKKRKRKRKKKKKQKRKRKKKVYAAWRHDGSLCTLKQPKRKSGTTVTRRHSTVPRMMWISNKGTQMVEYLHNVGCCNSSGKKKCSA